MKRSFTMTKEQNTNTSLSLLDGYVVNIDAVTELGKVLEVLVLEYHFARTRT
ncbi:unnamed protein product, partial [Adineta steineri]